MMSFSESSIPGAWVIDLDPKVDERGFFTRAWDASEFDVRGIDSTIVQMNMSESTKAGTFRGFHRQEPPHAETKTIRCVAGAVFDVIVDMRPDSPAFGTWFGVHLTARNLRVLCVPEGVANGYLAMEDESRVLYSVSRPFDPAATERGVRFDDPTIGVDWPMEVIFTSEKDRNWPDFPVEHQRAED